MLNERTLLNVDIHNCVIISIVIGEIDCCFFTPFGGLSRASICRNILRSVLYGDAKHEGIVLNNVYNTMWIQQNQALINDM